MHRPLRSARYYLGVVTFRGVEHRGRHQPLIPQSLFDRVQEVLAMHRHGDKHRIHRHYLKSTIWCGRCGNRLCLINAKGKYMYYFCVGRQQRRTGCDLPSLPAAEPPDPRRSLHREV
jgi:hypothetical protein